MSVPSFLRPSGSRYVHPLRTSDAREPSLRREDGDMRRESRRREGKRNVGPVSAVHLSNRVSCPTSLTVPLTVSSHSTPFGHSLPRDEVRSGSKVDRQRHRDDRREWAKNEPRVERWEYEVHLSLYHRSSCLILYVHSLVPSHHIINKKK